MKKVRLLIVGLLACLQLSAQTYDELITQAMNAVEKDSLPQAEVLLKQAMKLEPANMRNALAHIINFGRMEGSPKNRYEKVLFAV